ncbi:transient receptor potential cation channel subfamily A member 1 homolog isoform X2 [Clytia hemisphaerica]|uniref:transient receptor potential cation channel subfamily A member 1 homolog isoform X2 n=1 Tax=Clytia hemisphaerica TaxID=252671 RepID=UPI0034D51D08
MTLRKWKSCTNMGYGEGDHLLPLQTLTYKRQRSNSTPGDFNRTSTDTSNEDLTFQRDDGAYATNQLTLERMLNPSVFFSSIRETKKKRGAGPLQLGGLGGTGGAGLRTTPLISLHQAARDGQINIVRQHIQSLSKDRKKLNRKDQENSTALHYAVRYGHFNIVKLLVENGANVNVNGEYGATPLHYAARYVFKPSKTPAATPHETPLTSPAIRKSARGFKNLISNRRLSVVRKEDMPKVRQKGGNSPFQRSLRNLLGKAIIGNKKQCEVPLVPKLDNQTIHKSLEQIQPNLLTPHNHSELSQTQSNMELQSLFRRQQASTDDIGQSKPPSLEMNISETPVVIIGDSSKEMSDDVMSIDALIIPEIKNLTTSDDEIPSMKASKSLPEIADEANNIRKTQSEANFDTNGVNNDSSTRFKVMRLLNVPEARLKEESILIYLLEQKANVNAKDYYGSTPLHFASMRGNVTAARHLLNVKTIDIEAKDRTQMTALHSAASNGSYEVCDLLLQHGADIRCRDEEDMTPLHFASMEGHVDIVELLFDVGEKQGGYTMLAKMIMDQDRDDQTALHLAVENGHCDIVKLCISKGANVNFVKTNMNTPLHIACTSGEEGIVQTLVESEADIEAKNVLQETPLHRAALFNRINIVRYLLDRDAEIDCRDKDKKTPLMNAVRKDNVETVKLLLQRGADIKVKDAADKTSLYVAAEEDCWDVINIIRKIPQSSSLLEEFDKNENTPLHIASTKGHIKAVEVLLSMGSLIDAKNDQNLTPLHLASKYGRSRIVRLLLEESGTHNIVNDEDDASNTPLHLAALEGHENVLSILLEKGAAVDARNAMLWTPLDCAASRGWTWCAENLLDADSLIDPTDKAKTTPLHLASKEGHVDMIKLLISRKAVITRKDHLGRNCLDWAIENNQRDAALAILDCEQWKNALRNCTAEGNKVTTPMRKLIKKLPDVAEKVFDKCIKGNGLPVEHPQYEISCSYEFLEDSFTEWGPSVFDFKALEIKKQHVVHNANSNVTMDTQKKSYCHMIGRKLHLPGYVKKQTERKRNHPLKFMVQNERTKLLCHPLVTYLLRHKWRSLGRYFYYSKLFLYIIYLFFLTGFALNIITDKYECLNSNSTLSSNTTTPNSSGQTSYDKNVISAAQFAPYGDCICVQVFNVLYENKPSAKSRQFFVGYGKHIVLFLAVFSLIIEFAKLISQLHQYFLPHCVVEFTSYILSILYVIESFAYNGAPIEIMSRCTDWQRSLGAITVWLSWINLVLFMRKFPKLGIYVVMFTDILKTFAQFFTVFALFVISFGLGFHMMLYEQRPRAFSTPLRAILKTTMGMLGEFEYDTVFNDDYNPLPTAWVIYVAYLIVCCIIVMNLLVGLAVDDIKGVQEQAALKRLAMQVDLTLDVEKALPLSIQNKLIKTEELIYPNIDKGWSFWSFWSVKSPTQALKSQVIRSHETTSGKNLDMRENMKNLRNKMKTLEAQNNRIESMLNAIILHHDIKMPAEIAAHHSKSS